MGIGTKIAHQNNKASVPNISADDTASASCAKLNAGKITVGRANRPWKMNHRLNHRSNVPWPKTGAAAKVASVIKPYPSISVANRTEPGSKVNSAIASAETPRLFVRTTTNWV